MAGGDDSPSNLSSSEELEQPQVIDEGGPDEDDLDFDENRDDVGAGATEFFSSSAAVHAGAPSSAGADDGAPDDAGIVDLDTAEDDASVARQSAAADQAFREHVVVEAAAQDEYLAQFRHSGLAPPGVFVDEETAGFPREEVVDESAAVVVVEEDQAGDGDRVYEDRVEHALGVGERGHYYDGVPLELEQSTGGAGYEASPFDVQQLPAGQRKKLKSGFLKFSSLDPFWRDCLGPEQVNSTTQRKLEPGAWGWLAERHPRAQQVLAAWAQQKEWRRVQELWQEKTGDHAAAGLEPGDPGSFKGAGIYPTSGAAGYGGGKPSSGLKGAFLADYHGVRPQMAPSIAEGPPLAAGPPRPGQNPVPGPVKGARIVAVHTHHGYPPPPPAALMQPQQHPPPHQVVPGPGTAPPPGMKGTKASLYAANAGPPGKGHPPGAVQLEPRSPHHLPQHYPYVVKGGQHPPQHQTPTPAHQAHPGKGMKMVGGAPPPTGVGMQHLHAPPPHVHPATGGPLVKGGAVAPPPPGSAGYAAIPTGNGGYASMPPPGTGYVPSGTGYVPPGTGYVPPGTGYVPPGTGYVPPGTGGKGNSKSPTHRFVSPGSAGGEHPNKQVILTAAPRAGPYSDKNQSPGKGEPFLSPEGGPRMQHALAPKAVPPGGKGGGKFW
mmetsp:Transcript_13948/g.34450  ORF Transcript_13948/g.34450 Transcript_13948/m.34450 type:complete len:659 (-) Transcript_13948:185-2161(-)|eukprot:CAMPEP_0178995910 /NCGR_PEP_ID=MMETSP0795-20121207/8076_1 /TAXON_ID=88552 /ORGANISM="Amoebophrya sp., Strain Ameob2" /LENGTH=658 /DNA_ID=CAMNT_0020688243 /DNA_START=176 /DNA_END=2152 /DNA_ORIENTATION=+